MTNPTQHGQVPEALIDLIDAYAETRHRCGGVYNAKTEAARKAVIEALSGVQALSAAPAVLSDEAILNRTGCIDYSPRTAEYDLELIRWYRTQIASPAPQQSRPLSHPNREFPGLAQGAAITSESGAVYAPMPRAAYIEFDGREETAWHTPDQMRDFADRTHALRMQAAPKAAPEVGNSGFDHKTAADLLNNKTVSDEAVRKFVATSRWAHDERAALSATLLAMHGVLASREAEIALLKKALMEAEAAPQPAPAPLSEMPYEKRKAIQEGEQIGASNAWFKARHAMLDTVDRRNVFRAGFDRGWNEALAAQGGKCPMRSEP